MLSDTLRLFAEMAANSESFTEPGMISAAVAIVVLIVVFFESVVSDDE